MTVDPKAVDSACKAFHDAYQIPDDGPHIRWPDDYDEEELAEARRCMSAALEAARPFISAKAILALAKET